MNAMITKRNELLAKKIVQGLKSRNMEGYYAADRAEALRLALALIPEGSSVTMGGSMSAVEIGLVDAVKEGNYRFIDRGAYANPREAMLLAYDADVFLTSANAMTEDGIYQSIGRCRRLRRWRSGHHRYGRQDRSNALRCNQ